MEAAERQSDPTSDDVLIQTERIRTLTSTHFRRFRIRKDEPLKKERAQEADSSAVADG